jgi:hypothetical protein
LAAGVSRSFVQYLEVLRFAEREKENMRLIFPMVRISLQFNLAGHTERRRLFAVFDGSLP